MAAKNDYQTVVANWTKRAATAKAHGLQDSTWRTLAQHDLQNVLQGHSPMTDTEAADALLAGVGTPAIKDPEVGSSWTDIPGNIGGDVQGLVTGFIPGVANYVTSLPEQLQDFVKLAQNDAATQQKYGMETDGGIGAFIRDASKTPVFGALIPGLHTLAATTSEEGRKELAQHPASAAVDVMFAAKEAGLHGALGDEAAVNSAREAFQAGNPVRGTVRAGADALSHLPKVGRYFDRGAFNQQLLNLGLHSDIVENLSRPLQETKNAAQRELDQFIKGPITQAYKDLGLDDQGQRNLAEVAKNPGVNDANILALPAEQQSFLQSLRHLNSQWADLTEGNGTFKVPGPDGKLHVYSDSEPVVKAYQKVGKAQVLLDRATTKLADLYNRRLDRESKLQSRLGKVRRFGEADAELAKREDGPVTPTVIAEAAAPLVESFALRDPLSVYTGIFADQSKQALTAVLRDVKALSGEDGLFAKWDEAMRSGDYATANKLLTQIRQRFAHSSWDQTPYAQRFRDYVTEVRKEMVGIRSKMRSTGYTMRILKTAIRDEKAAIARSQTVQGIYDNATSDFTDQISKSPPAAYHPMIAEKIKEDSRNAVTGRLAQNSQELTAALRGIDESSTFAELRHWVGEEEANAIIKEAKSQWLDLSRSGVDPIFLHNVSPSQFDYITRASVLPNRYYAPGVVKKRIFNIGESVHNVMASITDHKRQLISEAATERHVNENIKPLVVDEAPLRLQLNEALRDAPRRSFVDLSALVQQEIDKNYVRFDPEKYGFAKYFQGAQGENLLIPKGYDVALKQLLRDNKVPVEGVFDKTTKLWKMSILTLPRHLSHIALGGTMMMALRDPMSILEYGRARQLVRADSELYQSIISQHINDVSTDQLFAFSAGKSIGRVIGEAVKKPIDWLNRQEEAVANWQKVAVTLSGESKGLSRDAAIRLANKTIVDMNSMLPIERVVLRKVFPFYGFTRHLFRYVMTYPVDHPVRASIMANLANQHREEWASGLPQSFSWLFFLGNPDQQGNVTGIDYRSIDPFRSAYNDFSLAGLTSGLNPVAQTVLSSMGVDVLSAAPELYPQSHYDPQTGTIVSERPQTGLAQIIEQILPPTQAIDALVGITDKYRNLKASNPRSYRNAITTALGIPFAPQDVNVPYEREKAAGKRFADASKAINEAITTGNFDDVRRYNLVPVPSLFKRFLGGQTYAPPAAIESVYQALVARMAQAGLNGVAPRAFLTPPTRRRTSH